MKREAEPIRVKIGIKSVKEVLDNFVKTGEAIERGLSFYISSKQKNLNT